MSEEVKRYNFYGDCDRETEENGEYILYSDHESTRQALADTKAQLEALEDAIALTSYECSKGDLYYTFENISKSDSDSPKYHKPIRQAIANSRARKQG